MYSADGSIYRQVPIGLVLPRDLDDVLHAVEVARSHGIPVLARGGGTSLEGQCVNAALVIDFSKYLNRVLEVDPGQAHRPRRAWRGVRPTAGRGQASRPDLRG